MSAIAFQAGLEYDADHVYLLTVVFGVLELPNVTLDDVWPGKDGENWERDRLHVDCRSPT